MPSGLFLWSLCSLMGHTAKEHQPADWGTLAPWAQVATARHGTDRQTPASWAQDLDTMRASLVKHHPQPFFQRPEASFDAELQRLRSDLPKLSTEQAWVRWAALVASLGDEHTGLAFPAEMQRSSLRVQRFQEGFFVTEAPAEATHLFGAQLLRVGGIPVLEVERRLASLLPTHSPGMLAKGIPLYLARPGVLRGLGMVDAQGQSGLSLRLATGEVVTTHLPLGGTSLRHPGAYTGLRWQKADQAYWHEVLGPGRVYLKVNRCQADPQRPFGQVVQAVMTALEAGPSRHLLVDLRDNPGGSSRLLEPLIKALMKGPPLDSLQVAIGRRTFSSAVTNSIQLRDLARATLVGEATSGKPNHFGEVHSEVLPISGLGFACSTRRFRLVPNDPSALEPEVAFPVTAADFLSGRDPLLSAFLQGTRR